MFRKYGIAIYSPVGCDRGIDTSEIILFTALFSKQDTPPGTSACRIFMCTFIFAFKLLRRSWSFSVRPADAAKATLSRVSLSARSFAVSSEPLSKEKDEVFCLLEASNI